MVWHVRLGLVDLAVFPKPYSQTLKNKTKQKTIIQLVVLKVKLYIITQKGKLTTYLLDSQGTIHLFKWLIRPVVEILYQEERYFNATIAQEP